MPGLVDAIFGDPATVKLSLNKAGHYHQGEKVAGVFLVDSGPSTVPKITLKVRGISKTEFRINRTRHKFRLFLVDKELTVNNLSAGKHQVPFEFQLPDTVVSTMNAGSIGFVRYWIEVEMEGFSLEQSEFDLPVQQLIDTNHWFYNFEVSGKDTETAGCCSEAVAITIEAKTDRAAYCAGESVAITAKFKNDSDVVLTPYVKFCRRIHFYGVRGAKTHKTDNWPTRPSDRRQGEDLMRGIERGSTLKWDKLKFVLPGCVPSINCENIKVNYFIRVGLGSDAEVKLPIVIGTVPYNHSNSAVQQQQPNPSSALERDLARTNIVRWTGSGSNAENKTGVPKAMPLLGPAMSISDPAYLLFLQRFAQQQRIVSP